MISHFMMAVPLMFCLLTGCIIAVPVPSVSDHVPRPDFTVVTMCKDSPDPSQIICGIYDPLTKTILTTTIDTLQKAKTIVDIVVDIAMKMYNMIDIVRGHR